MASHTRFPRALAAIFLLSLPACGDSTSTTTATTVATTDSGGPATATETTADITTTTTATTDNPTSTGTMGQTTSTATTTPETTSTTTTGVSATTTETTEGTTAVTTETSGETTEGTTSDTTTSETTGEPVGATCEQDSDCQVYTDCCTCDVLAVGEQPPACNVPECFVEACGVLDIGAPTAVCRFGRCTFEKVTCNPLGVTCKVQPPDCPVGQLPSVNGDCWSGQCTPVEACDWAPDCAACTTDPTDPLVCVFKAQKGAYHVCEPKPADCGDMAEIDCGCGQEICDASPPHTECHDGTPGIVCECPVC